jgi:hypothetical protein
MDTMQFAKYSCDIREILSKVDQEGLENLVRNAVAYAQSNNNGKANWIAQELLLQRFLMKSSFLWIGGITCIVWC